MNLKRSFLALVALILGVGIFGAVPQQAHAQTYGNVTCTVYTNTIMSFPHGKLWNCSPSANVNTVAAVLGGIGSDAKSKLDASDGEFYIFENYADWNDYCSNSAGAFPCASGVTSDVSGWTYTSSSSVPTSLLFYEFAWAGSVALSDLSATTAHEAGHQLDPLYGPTLSASEASASSLYTSKLAKDWTNFNALTDCGVGGVFRAKRDSLLHWICGSKVTATVGGTITNNNTITLTFTDLALSPNPDQVMVTVVTGDTTSTVAGKLAAAINANTNLTSHGISAIANVNQVNITSYTGREATYSKITTGTITLNIGTVSKGTADTLSQPYAGGDNETVLKQAWPRHFPDPAEIFAEEIKVDKTGTPSGNADPGHYFQNDNFACTLAIAHSLRLNGTAPTSWITPCL